MSSTSSSLQAAVVPSSSASSSSSRCQPSSLFPSLSLSSLPTHPSSAWQLDKLGSLRAISQRKSYFMDPFIAQTLQQEDPIEYVANEVRVLVVGAGGLGCEILKDLALSGFTDIHCIDLDTVDVSNLNRQFLFRQKDIGQPKAKIAAEFIERKYKNISKKLQVKWYNKPIQEFSKDWYKQFNIVIAGLDNIEARQWLNQTLVSLVSYHVDGSIDYDSIIPLIDGGTEAFAGQARLFIPMVTSCFECSLQSLQPQQGYPICTIRNVPRIPEHCIVWALKVQWPLLVSFDSVTKYQLYEKKNDMDEFAPSAVSLDKDDPQHMTWLYNRALERAAQYNIQGVTYNLTMQVVKNIIPAIASTNALISAACVNEAFKYASKLAPLLENYYVFYGGVETGVNTDTYKYQRNPDCSVCSPPTVYKCLSTITLNELLHGTNDSSSPSNEANTEGLIAKLSLQKPSVSIFNTAALLYLPNLHDMYSANLNQSLRTLLTSSSKTKSDHASQIETMLLIQDVGAKSYKVLLGLLDVAAEQAAQAAEEEEEEEEEE